MTAAKRVEIEFARELAMRRKAAGLSQQALADLMQLRGWSNFRQQTVLKIEKGARGVSLPEAVDLADALGSELTALLTSASLTPAEVRLTRIQRALWQCSVISQEALS